MDKKKLEMIDPKNLQINYNFQELLDEGVVTSNEVTGNWYLLDKSSLEGVPFIIVDWQFQQGKGQDGEYVNVHCVTKTNERICFNDGSSGIYKTLKTFTIERGNSTNIYCPRGLRVSRYTNEYGPAETWYLD